MYLQLRVEWHKTQFQLALPPHFAYIQTKMEPQQTLASEAFLTYSAKEHARLDSLMHLALTYGGQEAA